MYYFRGGTYLITSGDIKTCKTKWSNPNFFYIFWTFSGFLGQTAVQEMRFLTPWAPWAHGAHGPFGRPSAGHQLVLEQMTRTCFLNFTLIFWQIRVLVFRPRDPSTEHRAAILHLLTCLTAPSLSRRPPLCPKEFLYFRGTWEVGRVRRRTPEVG